ncbi:MAG: glycosyltransferase family 25 protein [Gemmobacter sp.]
MQLQDLAIPVWLINLPRATGRLATMQVRLQAIGLEYTPFPGVDGRAEADRLARNIDLAAFERNMGRRMLWGGMGCYHSHLGVWQAFLATDAPAALVLEDDVIFHDDFLEAVRTGLRGIAHWDFLKLNCIRAKLPVRQGRLGAYDLNAYVGPATGTGAYLITRACAARLLPAMRHVTRATDHEINRFFLHDFRLLGLEPFPSHPEPNNVSLITGTNNGDVVKLRGMARLPYYRLKAANYLRRAAWLARRGMLWPQRTQLLPEGPT